MDHPLLNHAHIALAAGQPTLASVLAAKVVRIQPSNAVAWFVLGHTTTNPDLRANYLQRAQSFGLSANYRLDSRLSARRPLSEEQQNALAQRIATLEEVIVENTPLLEAAQEAYDHTFLFGRKRLRERIEHFSAIIEAARSEIVTILAHLEAGHSAETVFSVIPGGLALARLG